MKMTRIHFFTAVLLAGAVLAFSSCMTSGQVNETNGMPVEMFGAEAVINSSLPSEISEEGVFLRGTLLKQFRLGNDKASFIIPAGIDVEYNDESKSYIFNLQEDTAEVIAPSITYKVHGFLMFNEEYMFTGRVARDYSFTQNGQEIIFLINDNPVWSSESDFDYDFYSKKYRDKIEYDVLSTHSVVTLDDLKLQFAAHDGYGMQVYRGEGFLLSLDTAEVDLSIESISDEEDIIRNFKGMKVGRPYISSYRHQLKVPLLVQQPDETEKEGYIELIMTNDEYENVKRIISGELPVYLMFRMAMFNDFSSSGYGILYFSFDEEQYETILSSF